MMQALLIRYILEPLGHFVGKVNIRVREGIFMLSAAALFVPCFFQEALFLGKPYLLIYAWGCLWTGLLILSVLPSKLHPIRWRMPMLASWVGFGLLVLLSAVRFNFDWVSEAILFLVIVPVMSIVWANCDVKRIYGMLRRACMGSFLVYVILSAWLVPIGSKQYGGLIPNVNGAAMYLTLAFACLLAECMRKDLSKHARVLCCVVTGMCFAMIFYTNSRTGQLAAIVALLVVFAVMAFAERHAFSRKDAVRMLCVVLAIAVMLPVTVHLIRGGNIVAATVKELFLSNEPLPPTGDTPPSLDSFLDYTGDKLETGNKDLNAISTGRINIWKVYLQESSLFGTGKEERLWIESRGEYYVTAHMTLLTYAFRHGFVAALLFLVFNLLSGIRAIRFALEHRGEAWALLPLAVTVAFGAVSVLASVNTPFSYMITIYYYFVQAPLFARKPAADNTDLV